MFFIIARLGITRNSSWELGRAEGRRWEQNMKTFFFDFENFRFRNFHFFSKKSEKKSEKSEKNLKNLKTAQKHQKNTKKRFSRKFSEIFFSDILAHFSCPSALVTTFSKISKKVVGLGVFFSFSFIRFRTGIFNLKMILCCIIFLQSSKDARNNHVLCNRQQATF